MKVILTESQIKRVLEQKNDLITSLKQMGFVPSGNGVFKHSQKPELTVTLAGDIVIVKHNGQKIAEIKTSNIEDLEGTIKSTSLNEQVVQGDKGDPYEYKKDGKYYYARKKGSNKWILTRGNISLAIAKKFTPITKNQGLKKSVKTNTSNDNDVLVSDTLVKKHILFNPKRETTPFQCSESGCAEWVSNQLDDLGLQRQGNAWHSHNIGENTMEFTPFKNLSPNTQKQMANLFSKINANPTEKSQENEAKALLTSLIPNQQSLKKILNVNDVVGLFYNDSTNFTKAFFEGATGYDKMGKGVKVTKGPYFMTKTGQPWNPSDLGKKIEFVPGNSLKNGSGFGINTHLGYVGAVIKGEPVIFHNVHGEVYSTPLSKMGQTKVLWVKTGPAGLAVNPKLIAPSWWESFVDLFY